MTAAPNAASPVERARVLLHGSVQGVGFRPFVYRIAVELRLSGSVRNSPEGVVIEVEGDRDHVRRFLTRLRREHPPGAEIREVDCTFQTAQGDAEFAISESEDGGDGSGQLPVDTASCPDCLRELFDPANRRFRYPFINCAHCGPRTTIIERLPYDRARTSMRGFVLCADCEREFRDPRDRRHHAQPIACPACGPRLTMKTTDGRARGEGEAALRRAADLLRDGGILALKGVGGFQLLVDARRSDAVATLRARKQRPDKPLAIMMATPEDIHREAFVSPVEERLLNSPEAPIVLLRRRDPAASRLAPPVAPGSPCLGVMLPSSPLHHLLLNELGFPVVATSGNRGNEPICIDEAAALTRLRGIADGFLTHDRPIVRRLDDSVVRVVAGHVMTIRRARGYAFRPVTLSAPVPPVLALGGHLKNAVAIGRGREVVLGPHVGDLETPETLDAFEEIAREIPHLARVEPALVAHDQHPDYASSRSAARSARPTRAVQHHWAHVLACLGEHGIEPADALGVAWDGTGLGPDGTIWGGEFLVARGDAFARVAHLRTFRLPGGDAAVREPRRSALGLCFALREPPPAGIPAERAGVLQRMIERGLHSPRTSSAGRLFDAVAALLGVRQTMTFEGQAAMELEALVEPGVDAAYPFALRAGDPAILDWESTIRALLSERAASTPQGVIAARFHNTLAEMIVAVAHRVGRPLVALTGGCFQNAVLLECTVRRLRTEGFDPCWPRLVPANDGGLALGQVLAVARAQSTPQGKTHHVPGHTR